MRAPLALLMIALLAASEASDQGRQRFVQGGGGSPSGSPSGGSVNSGSSQGSGQPRGSSQPRSEAAPSARAAVPRESRPSGDPAPRISSAPRSEAPRPNSGGSVRSERSAMRREPAPTQLASTPAAPAATTAPRSAIRYPG